MDRTPRSTSRSHLIRYWIEFDLPPSPSVGATSCCGITAYSIDDALAIAQAELFAGEPLPPTSTVIENVDVSTLDPGHVLVNIGVPIWRGVWYPNVGVA